MDIANIKKYAEEWLEENTQIFNEIIYEKIPSLVLKNLELLIL